MVLHHFFAHFEVVRFFTTISDRWFSELPRTMPSLGCALTLFLLSAKGCDTFFESSLFLQLKRLERDWPPSPLFLSDPIRYLSPRTYGRHPHHSQWIQSEVLEVASPLVHYLSQSSQCLVVVHRLNLPPAKVRGEWGVRGECRVAGQQIQHQNDGTAVGSFPPARTITAPSCFWSRLWSLKRISIVSACRQCQYSNWVSSDKNVMQGNSLFD